MEVVEWLSIGAMTFHNLSVIDYSTVSHHALQVVHMYEILEVDPLFSDGHSLLSTTLCFFSKFYIEYKQVSQTKCQRKAKINRS